MDSCQGYPIWVHANTNNNNWTDRMEIACKEKGCHYFSRSMSNGTPGRGKNLLMHHFTVDSNLKYFDYFYLNCFLDIQYRFQNQIILGQNKGRIR